MILMKWYYDVVYLLTDVLKAYQLPVENILISKFPKFSAASVIYYLK